MLTRIRASEDQIDKILRKHLNRVFHVDYSWDAEDSQGFVWCSSSIFGIEHYEANQLGLGILQWQVRDEVPMFFSFQKGSHSYDVAFPEGKLLERLKSITKKSQKSFWRGGQI